MWYKILIENEFADYFINSDPCPQSDAENQKAEEMLQGYAEIVEGVILAITFYDSPKKSEIYKSLAQYSLHSAKAIEFCLGHASAFESISIGEIFRSIDHNMDIELLSAEQCAVKIIYPFLSRMGGSFEKEFYASGSLKKCLMILKDKCTQ